MRRALFLVTIFVAALATARAVRAADPGACIVGPTTSGFDWNFIEAVFKSGLLEYLNGVSVHPYRGKPPETASAASAASVPAAEMLTAGFVNVPDETGLYDATDPPGRYR